MIVRCRPCFESYLLDCSESPSRGSAKHAHNQWARHANETATPQLDGAGAIEVDICRCRRTAISVLTISASSTTSQVCAVGLKKGSSGVTEYLGGVTYSNGS